MLTINQKSLVPYSAEQMYQLVNNYEDYPKFVPGCVASRVIVEGDNQQIGELTISKAGISQKFSTRNTMIANRSINMQLVEGPFKSLSGEWAFVQIDEKCCEISFRLDFEFSNALISLAFGKIFTHLTTRMIDAFKQQAKEIYSGTN
ncbi:MAG TPA: ubiquinone-binding protein [Pasteurellaceae bacterium]|nr:ubiquinone-binding protein [Pasteurellaceae bacterium]